MTGKGRTSVEGVHYLKGKGRISVAGVHYLVEKKQPSKGIKKKKKVCKRRNCKPGHHWSKTARNCIKEKKKSKKSKKKKSKKRK